MNRRDFLKHTRRAVATATLVSPFDLVAQNSHVPTIIWAKRNHDNLRVDFSTPEGYRAISWLLRDIQQNTVGIPDWRLLQLLAWLQAWLAAYNIHTCLNLHSGLRTYETNRRTEGAAQASFHLPDKFGVFRAADFDTGNIPSTYMGKLANYAAQGGVGIYINSNFTHVDTGAIFSAKGSKRIWVK